MGSVWGNASTIGLSNIVCRVIAEESPAYHRFAFKAFRERVICGGGRPVSHRVTRALANPTHRGGGMGDVAHLYIFGNHAGKGAEGHNIASLRSVATGHHYHIIRGSDVEVVEAGRSRFGGNGIPVPGFVDGDGNVVNIDIACPVAVIVEGDVLHISGKRLCIGLPCRGKADILAPSEGLQIVSGGGIAYI